MLSANTSKQYLSATVLFVISHLQWIVSLIPTCNKILLQYIHNNDLNAYTCISYLFDDIIFVYSTSFTVSTGCS